MRQKTQRVWNWIFHLGQHLKLPTLLLTYLVRWERHSTLVARYLANTKLSVFSHLHVDKGQLSINFPLSPEERIRVHPLFISYLFIPVTLSSRFSRERKVITSPPCLLSLMGSATCTKDANTIKWWESIYTLCNKLFVPLLRSLWNEDKTDGSRIENSK